MKILNAVMNGGMARQKAIQKGQLASGETAYDYEYNDGLGASTFRKKKVRILETMMSFRDFALTRQVPYRFVLCRDRVVAA